MSPRSLGLLLPVLLGAALHDAAGSTLERELRLTLQVDGQQTWKNELQWSRGRTTQRYELSTRLRSDGRRFADNLLDPELQRRLDIKQQYLALRGLEKLRARHGGHLPDAAALAADGTSDAEARACMAHDGDEDCATALAERVAALTALRQNSIADLEAFLDEARQPDGRYLYFFGFEGCPGRIRVRISGHQEGMRAFDRHKKNLVPVSFDMQADGEGTAAEQRSLCRRYVATLDTQSGDFFLENAYVPSAMGRIVRTVDGTATSGEGSLPLATQALDWMSERLRRTRASGSDEQVFRFTRPLDGDATVLGDFDGTLKARLQWSFEPAAP